MLTKATLGRKWIHNPKTQEEKKVNPEDLPKYLSDGWFKGKLTKPNLGKKYIYNPKTQEQKCVYPEDLPKYLSGEWVEGRLTKSNLGKKWIHNPKTQEEKHVNPEDLPKYISEGWFEGLPDKARENLSTINSGRKWIYNPQTQEQKMINPEDLPKYISGGWLEGTLTKPALGKKWIHNSSTQEEKMINPEDMPKYLSEGWVLGMSDKARENNSKGQKELHADPERAEVCKRKTYDTKKKNGTFNTSKSEEKLYEILLKQNPGKTIISQYWDDRYPFSCDFYIVEDDLFIELNGGWKHGYHPYNPEDPEDQKTLEWLREKAKISDSYDNAIYVWTDLDVRKQKIAKENNLNYRMIYPDEYKKIVKQYA